MRQALHGFPVDSLITRTVVLSVFILLLFVSLMAPPGICMSIRDPKDSIANLSFNHDGKKVVFDRCRNEGCQIQVYDLESGELAAYQSPENGRWTMGKYSYDGKRITFSVIPIKPKGGLDLGEMQIAVMDADGKNYRKVTTGPGAKLYPIFSHNGKKILYACAARIREKGGTPAAQYDAWEVNLETGQQTQLTFFKYYYMSNLTYFPDDERFIYFGENPSVFEGAYADQSAFRNKLGELGRQGKGIHYVVVMKGKELIPNPYKFPPNVQPEKPLLSKDGSILIYEKSMSAGKFFLYSPDGNHKLVGEGGSVNSAAISPDGESLAMISVDLIMGIYTTRDGNALWCLYLPRTPKKITNWSIPPKYKEIYKMIPEEPSRIINK
ncbi:MAG: TolB family protein [Smithellaceae bacterium]